MIDNSSSLKLALEKKEQFEKICKVKMKLDQKKLIKVREMFKDNNILSKMEERRRNSK